MVNSALPELENEPVESLHDRSILIVDDDDAQVSALSYRFEQLGYRTMTANSGLQGLETAQERRPDVILLDLCLPDLEGFEVCERISSDAGTCHIPIIIVSGIDNADVVKRSRAAGCKFYLKKPYDPNSLLVLVEQAVNDAESW